MSKFLTNKWVLRVIAFLALLNVIGYLVMGNLNAVMYFIIFAVLIRYFSKNMTIVLGAPLILVNLLAIKGNVLEGMESGGTADDTANPVTKPAAKKAQEKINNIVNKNSSGTTLTSSAASTDTTAPDNSAQSTGGEQQGFETGRRKNRGYDIDYATTIEDAYDELNNILGSDGIQRLTSDTQNLMQQQMQLAKAMEGMTPVIQSIAPMVQNLQGMMGQMGEGKDGLGSIMDLAKKFSNQNAPAK
jgi:hypothetical protein